jgi:uncharacterized protein YneF (UPF0154 family)
MLPQVENQAPDAPIATPEPVLELKIEDLPPSGAGMNEVIQVPSAAEAKVYPSLYDTIPTTIAAIAIGVGIIGGIQWTVRKIFSSEKMEHKALTQFVTAMFALIVGVWIADKLIAGPSTELLLPEESTQLLTFIKDITLMVFSYYFGTKANVPTDVAPEE